MNNPLPLDPPMNEMEIQRILTYVLSLSLEEAFEAVIVHEIIDIRLLPPEFYEAITADCMEFSENENDENSSSESDENSSGFSDEISSSFSDENSDSEFRDSE